MIFPTCDSYKAAVPGSCYHIDSSPWSKPWLQNRLSNRNMHTSLREEERFDSTIRLLQKFGAVKRCLHARIPWPDPQIADARNLEHPRSLHFKMHQGLRLHAFATCSSEYGDASTKAALAAVEARQQAACHVEVLVRTLSVLYHGCP